MLYLKNALGGIGRSVTCTARHAFAHAGGAARWRKAALYAAMFVLPGGSIAVVLMMWADRRRSQRGGQSANSSTSMASSPAAAIDPTAAAKATCTNVAHSARVRAHGALHALRRWRGNGA